MARSTSISKMLSRMNVSVYLYFIIDVYSCSNVKLHAKKKIKKQVFVTDHTNTIHKDKQLKNIHRLKKYYLALG